jgi:hypothetical protein
MSIPQADGARHGGARLCRYVPKLTARVAHRLRVRRSVTYAARLACLFTRRLLCQLSSTGGRLRACQPIRPNRLIMQPPGQQRLTARCATLCPALGRAFLVARSRGVTGDGDYPRSCRTEAVPCRPLCYVGGLADDDPVKDHRADAAKGADVVRRPAAPATGQASGCPTGSGRCSARCRQPPAAASVTTPSSHAATAGKLRRYSRKVSDD